MSHMQTLPQNFTHLSAKLQQKLLGAVEARRVRSIPIVSLANILLMSFQAHNPEDNRSKLLEAILFGPVVDRRHFASCHMFLCARVQSCHETSGQYRGIQF